MDHTFMPLVASHVISWIVGIIIILLLIAIWTWWTGRVPDDKLMQINRLIRQTYRWYIAAAQDTNPVIKMLHSNYAVGYLDALRLLASDEEILGATGMNIRDVQKNILKMQDASLLEVYKACPAILPKLPGDSESQNYLQSLIQKTQETAPVHTK